MWYGGVVAHRSMGCISFFVGLCVLGVRRHAI